MNEQEVKRSFQKVPFGIICILLREDSLLVVQHAPTKGRTFLSCHRYYWIVVVVFPHGLFGPLVFQLSLFGRYYGVGGIIIVVVVGGGGHYVVVVAVGRLFQIPDEGYQILLNPLMLLLSSE